MSCSKGIGVTWSWSVSKPAVDGVRTRERHFCSFLF